MNRKVKKGLDIAAIVLVCIIFILGIMMLSISLTQRKNGVPKFLGVTFLDVVSDSMEDTINVHDLAVIKNVKSVENIKVDDIITFKTFKDNKPILNTHRVIEIVEVPESVSQYKVMFRTKGDNVTQADIELVDFVDIVGEYKFRLHGMGYVVNFLKSPWGFFFIIILPLLGFLGYRIYILAKVILVMRKAKLPVEGDVDSLKQELEELRAKVALMDDDPKGNTAKQENSTAETKNKE